MADEPQETALRTYFKLADLVKWLGLTQFEIETFLISLLLFSVLLTAKVSELLPWLDWANVFVPLFAADASNAYFVVIVFTRMYLSNKRRQAFYRLLWSAQLLVLVIIFKYLLYLRLNGQTGLEFSEIFSPIFVLLQLIAVRACQFKSN